MVLGLETCLEMVRSKSVAELLSLAEVGVLQLSSNVGGKIFKTFH